MVEIVLFHHAQGLTQGVVEFADTLRAAGHQVHTPDLYEGQVFETLDAGVAYCDGVGMDGVIKRGVATVAEFPPAVVYAGFSLGSVVAQALTQQRPGAVGTSLFHGGASPTWFGPPWPTGVPLQIHTMTDDPWFEREPAEELIAAAMPNVEFFEYQGNAHLFADSSLDAYDPAAAELLMDRTLAFLTAL